MEEKLNTEDKILKAAEEVFLESGGSGARMQAIADKAGINKSLLHYYFRSKEKLYLTVFKVIFGKISNRIPDIFTSDEEFYVKLDKFVDFYLHIIINNPFLPMFILSELNKKGNNIAASLIKNSGLNITKIESVIQSEIDLGRVKNTNPRELIINILSLCVFPIISRPIIQEVLFSGSSEDYEEYLSRRKDEILRIILASISN